MKGLSVERDYAILQNGDLVIQMQSIIVSKKFSTNQKHQKTHRKN